MDSVWMSWIQLEAEAHIEKWILTDFAARPKPSFFHLLKKFFMDRRLTFPGILATFRNNNNQITFQGMIYSTILEEIKTVQKLYNQF